jgi:hypothetical protein
VTLVGKGGSAEGSIGLRISRASIRASIHTSPVLTVKQASLSRVVAVVTPMT